MDTRLIAVSLALTTSLCFGETRAEPTPTPEKESAGPLSSQYPPVSRRQRTRSRKKPSSPSKSPAVAHTEHHSSPTYVGASYSYEQEEHHCNCPDCPEQYNTGSDCCVESCPSDCCYDTEHYEELCCPPTPWCSYAFVDFLYWYARETKLTYAQRFKVVNQLMDSANDSSSTFVFAPRTSEHFGTHWDPGLRVGRGWYVDDSGWDFVLFWTYFKNCVKDHTDLSGFSFGTLQEFPGFAQSGLINPWINPSFNALSASDNENLPFVFNKVAAKWELQFNSLDFEIGKKFCFNPCFNMRFYSGFRFAWTRTEFETKSSRHYTDTFSSQTDIIFHDRFRNCFWGGGILAGIQPNWYFTRCYSLFGNFEAALIWGKYELTKRERYKKNQTDLGRQINFKSTSDSDFFQIAAMIDLAIGMRWEQTWCCDAFKTSLSLAWEQHIWFDQNERYKVGAPFSIQENPALPSMTGYGEYKETCTNLMYGGLTVRFQVDF